MTEQKRVRVGEQVERAQRFPFIYIRRTIGLERSVLSKSKSSAEGQSEIH